MLNEHPLRNAGHQRGHRAETAAGTSGSWVDPPGGAGFRHRAGSLASAPENRSTVYSLGPGRAEVEGANVTRPKTGPAVDDQATRSANRTLHGASDVKTMVTSRYVVVAGEKESRAG
jgi:hypothetical protein